MKKKGDVVFISSDHAGFEMKEKLKELLSELELDYEDLGPKKLDPEDDYPDFAFKLAEKVAKTNSSKGVLVCGSGIGMCIAANKVKGIRAVNATDSFTAVMSRTHNDANVLCLPGKEYSLEELRDIVAIWLETPFSNEERHKRRIKKISKYENKK